MSFITKILFFLHGGDDAIQSAVDVRMMRIFRKPPPKYIEGEEHDRLAKAAKYMTDEEIVRLIDSEQLMWADVPINRTESVSLAAVNLHLGKGPNDPHRVTKLIPLDVVWEIEKKYKKLIKEEDDRNREYEEKLEEKRKAKLNKKNKH